MEKHDAYNTFTELYTPLVNTLTYIAEHSSEFTSDTVKKASSFLDGIIEFQFIATLIIEMHILSTTQILSKLELAVQKRTGHRTGMEPCKNNT